MSFFLYLPVVAASSLSPQCGVRLDEQEAGRGLDEECVNVRKTLPLTTPQEDSGNSYRLSRSSRTRPVSSGFRGSILKMNGTPQIVQPASNRSDTWARNSYAPLWPTVFCNFRVGQKCLTYSGLLRGFPTVVQRWVFNHPLASVLRGGSVGHQPGETDEPTWQRPPSPSVQPVNLASQLHDTRAFCCRVCPSTAQTRGGLSVVNPGFLGDSGTVQRGSSSGRSSVPVPLGAMEEAWAPL